MYYIQLDAAGRVIAYMQGDANPDANVWRASPWDTPPDDFNDYKVIGGQLVYDKRIPTEQEIEEQKRGEVVANILQIVEDTDAAICELYEMIVGGDE